MLTSQPPVDWLTQGQKVGSQGGPEAQGVLGGRRVSCALGSSGGPSAQQPSRTYCFGEGGHPKLAQDQPVGLVGAGKSWWGQGGLGAETSPLGFPFPMVSPPALCTCGGADVPSRLQNPTQNLAGVGWMQMGVSGFQVTWHMQLRKPGNHLRRKNIQGELSVQIFIQLSLGPGS